MKLRIRGNSIRLRLSQTELASMLAHGAVEERVAFPSGQALSYRLERGTGRAAEADFGADRLVVSFPAEAVERWARPDEVAMHAEQDLGGGRRLTLLVEKDFRCLTPREDEDDADLFPNPSA